ncbi:hypothetical protein DSO57_1014411 [Entomophthora muscae]|uniref:Uncharacterized protein n=1 Tax=Entomophthora muscae TaxID=34485 RepID=A0ACC2UEE0_9FUNG|nr:hypothetical protein DSO57_1014411 [Entomophthora muscae]
MKVIKNSALGTVTVDIDRSAKRLKTEIVNKERRSPFYVIISDIETAEIKIFNGPGQNMQHDDSPPRDPENSQTSTGEPNAGQPPAAETEGQRIDASKTEVTEPTLVNQETSDRSQQIQPLYPTRQEIEEEAHPTPTPYVHTSLRTLRERAIKENIPPPKPFQ